MKPGTRWLIFNAPDLYVSILEPLPENIILTYQPEGVVNGAQIFVKDAADLSSSLREVAGLLKPDTVFWIIYPKKSSGIPTDLEMTGSWDACEKYGLRPVSSAAIDEKWTALRFKPSDQVKTSEGSAENVRQNEYQNYIDVDKRQITLPAVMIQALKNYPEALNFYHRLSFTNKKEYLLWILTAKQEKTRNERLSKLVEKLSAGLKNPSHKLSK